MPPTKRDIVNFQPVGSYNLPRLQTANVLERLTSRARRFIRRPEDDPVIANERLQRFTRTVLDEVVAPPACGPLLEEIQATFADWASDAESPATLKLVILPPGDQNNVVATWALEEGHQILQPPDREALLTADFDAIIPVLNGDGVLVIPQLERWFLRHRNGLGLIRELLRRLDSLERRCLIACNSWAWAFLGKAVDANMILPAGMTFKAFDAQRLRNWFIQLSESENSEMRTFRLSQSGEDVMAVVNDDDKPHPYFNRLAARSFGIPWVAWHLWRRSLRSDSESEEGVEAGDSAKANDVRTLWVAAPEELSLPVGHSEYALLVLQALLIHDALTVEELDLLLPAARRFNTMPALLSAGFIQRHNDELSCVPAAYPAIRNGLATAGFPLDRL